MEIGVGATPVPTLAKAMATPLVVHRPKCTLPAMATDTAHDPAIAGRILEIRRLREKLAKKPLAKRKAAALGILVKAGILTPTGRLAAKYR